MTSGDAQRFSWSVRVCFHDTDAGGVAHHTAYFRWFEAARTEILAAQGRSEDHMLKGEGVALAVVEAAVKYRKPAQLGDLVEIHTHLVRSTRITMEFEQSAMTNGADLAHATIKMACLRLRDGRPVALPPTDAPASGYGSAAVES